MRILAYEVVSAGHLPRRNLRPSLIREGRAMLTALVSDLARLRDHDIVTVKGPRSRLKFPASVQVVKSSGPGWQGFDALVASVDAVWLIAPETDGRLERLTARVERHGKLLLGSDSRAIRDAADKAALARRLACCALPYPKTRVFRTARLSASTSGIEFPVVLKPARGAGCEDVYLVRNKAELAKSIRGLRRSKRHRKLIVQRYIEGVSASVSAIADGTRAIPLALNAQSLDLSRSVSYRGGCTPLGHRHSEDALSVAASVCRAVPGLRGYFGVDVVLTDRKAVIVDINPRLTTAYLGVRAALDDNVAALAIEACVGGLPRPSEPRRRVRFTADGHITSSRRLEAVRGLSR
jgi:predicted ATP-grasp superfamily ATP-dependent carboligase